MEQCINTTEKKKVIIAKDNHYINIIKMVVVFIFLLLLNIFVNKNHDILALFIDDLNSFTYFPNNNIFEYAFKFYEGMTHYRPFYEFFQYIAFFIAGHNPHILFIINIVVNSFIAFYIFLFVERITKSTISSIVVSVIYLISHFSCYQINQATGLMESIGTFLAIYILSNCFRIVNGTSSDKVTITILAYFCIALTHERYIVLIGLIIFSLFLSILSKVDININARNNHKLFLGIILIIAVLIFVMILRYYATGKIIPAGTSGTRVEETFKLSQFFEYIKRQFLFIFGFNIGDEASCGITYEMLKTSTKMMINLQAISIIFYIIIYIILKARIIVSKISSINENKKTKTVILNIKDDLLFIGFIISCICVSSITVMLEIRFMYVSFIAFIIYLVYMFSYIKRQYYASRIGIYLIVGLILFLSLYFRVAVEFRYREGNENIYYMIDQRRLNSLAKETVYKYGNDVIDNKKIYILNNSFFYTKRYAQYLLQIYQINYEIREIGFINSIDELKQKGIKEREAIILVEDKKDDKYFKIEVKDNE